MLSKRPINIAIFASGAGTNAREIIRHCKGSDVVKVSLIVSNKPNAGVLEVAKEYAVEAAVLDRNTLNNESCLSSLLSEHKIDLIVLAGFMMLIPEWLVKLYRQRIVNIHPALLPKFGGKGMYGMNVHKAVKEAGETETGITIHFVDEVYDHGEVIFQAKTAVSHTDTPEAIAEKVRLLEHRHFPPAVEDIARKIPTIL
jgi:phosphoribosylglycinamide formyltransferase-1